MSLGNYDCWGIGHDGKYAVSFTWRGITATTYKAEVHFLLADSHAEYYDRIVATVEEGRMSCGAVYALAIRPKDDPGTIYCAAWGYPKGGVGVLPFALFIGTFGEVTEEQQAEMLRVFADAEKAPSDMRAFCRDRLSKQ